MKKLMFLLVFCALSFSSVWAQKTISGQVTSAEDGLGLPGVNVVVKSDPSIGTATDINGKWTLVVPNNNVILVFTAIGMQPIEIIATKSSNIVMKQNSQILEEVVVTGMGMSREKKTLGYATQEVKSEDLVQTRQTDLNNALVGKVSGVKFSGASGATFDAGSIVLRGTTSLSAKGSSPIYVVDGVITNANSVNMDDVESVNVLKGPAATAIYGSRGGNGAIIITTKTLRGAGQQTIEISHTIAFERVKMLADYQTEYGGGQYGANAKLNVFKYDSNRHPSYLKKLDGAKYYDYNTDVSWGPKFDSNTTYAPWYAWDPTHPKFGELKKWEAAANDDVLDLFRTGVSNTTNVAFAKAGEDYMTRVSFTNVDRKGVIPNSDAVRRFLAFKTNYNLSDKLHLSLDYKYTYRKNHNGAQEGYQTTRNAHYTFQQWFNRNVSINELKDYKRPDGTFRSWNINSLTDLSPAYHNNPFALFNEINKRDIYQWNVFNGRLTYDITEKLSAAFIVNGNLRNYRGEFEAPQNLLDVTSKYSTDQSELVDMQYQGMLAYENRYWNDRIAWDANLFIETRRYRYNSVGAFTRDGLFLNKFYSVNASKGLPGGENYKKEQNTKSIFGRTSISLDDTYFIELSLRNDWSSTLPDDNNNFLYGGISLSILAHKWINKEWLNFWKIRTSAAQVGSSLDPYNVYPVYVVTDRDGKSLKYGQLTKMLLDRKLKNSNIEPTISTSYEIGTEFRMFNNRLWGDLNLYRRDSKNQIIDLDVAPQSGYNSKVENAGLIRNQGLELSLGADIIKNNEWVWSVDGNISFNENTLEELTEGIKQYQLYRYGFSNKVYSYAEVGEPIGVIRGTDFAKDPEGNIILKKWSGQNKEKLTKKYGEYDVVRNLDESTYLGNIQPDATGGFSTSLSYKGFRISTSFDFQIGGKIASVTNMFGEGSGLLASTAGKNKDGVDIRADLAKGGGMYIKGVENVGTKEKPIYKKVEARINPYLYYSYRKSSVWGPNVYDTSYLKMREIALSYNLPKSFIKNWGGKIGIKEMRLSLIAQNPWLIYSGVPNLDPSETSGSNYSLIEGGQAYSTRTYGFTVNIKF